MLEVEKTHFLTVNDKTIPITQLPQQIREQVEMFDKIRQDALEKSYELTVLQLAAEQKKAQLQNLMQQYSDAQAENENKKADSENPKSGEVDLTPSDTGTSKKKKTTSKRSSPDE